MHTSGEPALRRFHKNIFGGKIQKQAQKIQTEKLKCCNTDLAY